MQKDYPREIVTISGGARGGKRAALYKVRQGIRAAGGDAAAVEAFVDSEGYFTDRGHALADEIAAAKDMEAKVQAMRAEWESGQFGPKPTPKHMFDRPRDLAHVNKVKAKNRARRKANKR